MNKLLIGISFMGSVMLYACCKTECIKDGSLWVSYQSFRQVEVDTVALVSYRKGTNELIDTTWQYTPSNPTDTSWAQLSSRLVGEADWKVHIPALNRTVSITGILIASSECDCERGRSYYVRGFKVDNEQRDGNLLIMGR